jgi:hypothetical protein
MIDLKWALKGMLNLCAIYLLIIAILWSYWGISMLNSQMIRAEQQQSSNFLLSPNTVSPIPAIDRATESTRDIMYAFAFFAAYMGCEAAHDCVKAYKSIQS